MINLYEYINGKVVNIKEDYIVLDNNGIGFRIFTSKNSLSNIKIDGIMTMYIYYNLRDDGINLYGFTTEEELDMFNMLILVSRIGPKVGLGILSTLVPNQIKLAILNNDTDTLCKSPGIGKKTADRMILELKDRIDTKDIIEDGHLEGIDDDVEIAINGIMSLGYTRGEVLKITNKMDTMGICTEDIMKEVLKRLSTQ